MDKNNVQSKEQNQNWQICVLFETFSAGKCIGGSFEQ